MRNGNLGLEFRWLIFYFLLTWKGILRSESYVFLFLDKLFGKQTIPWVSETDCFLSMLWLLDL